MRLTPQQIQAIRAATAELAGSDAKVRVFGSRLDDTKRGGDVDLLLEMPLPVDQPALLAARLAAEISRLMHGRKVDIIVAAPNLQHLPIHDVARREGVLL